MNAFSNPVVVSVIGSGIRTEFWLRLYDSLSKTKISFEIVLTGNKKPDFKLPKNFKHIYATVKPSQAVEISARYSEGDFLMIVADDLVFSDNFLDHMVSHFKNHCSSRDYVISRFIREGRLLPLNATKFWPNVSGSPVMPMTPLIPRKLWQKIGGVDISFIAVFYDLDIALRIQENGGNVSVCETAFTKEVLPYENVPKVLRVLKKLLRFRSESPKGLYQEYGKDFDRPLLNSFWTKQADQLLVNEEVYTRSGGLVHLKRRLKNPRKFSGTNILHKSQGPKGRWD